MCVLRGVAGNLHWDGVEVVNRCNDNVQMHMYTKYFILHSFYRDRCSSKTIPYPGGNLITTVAAILI